MDRLSKEISKIMNDNFEDMLATEVFGATATGRCSGTTTSASNTPKSAITLEDLLEIERKLKATDIISCLSHIMIEKGFSLENGDMIVFSDKDLLKKKDIPADLKNQIMISAYTEKGQVYMMKKPNDFWSRLVDV